jgi:hypothetical protein
MNALTVSKSGTAWIQHMHAHRKSPAASWSSSPNAAYYASLDENGPSSTLPPGLPSSLVELMKLRQAPRMRTMGCLKS